MKKAFALVLSALVVIIGLYGVVAYYSYIFSHKVIGVVDNVQKLDVNVSLLQSSSNEQLNSGLFSFGVAIKDDKGEIFTASSEDRQWSVAKVGQCVEARFYPYPPWNLEKSGTYMNARLVKLWECSKAQ